MVVVAEIVVTIICVDTQAVPFIRLMDKREVVVAEPVFYRTPVHLYPLRIEQIEIGFAGGEDYCRLLPHPCLQRGLRRHRTYGEFAVRTVSAIQSFSALEFVHCPGRPHIHRSAYPVGRVCRHVGFPYLHIGKVPAVEHGEDTEQMAGSVYRHSVERHHIMLVVASLDMESGVVFRVGLYAGHQLGIVQWVGITENLRHVGHELHPDDVHAVNAPQCRPRALSPYLHALQLYGVIINIERIGNGCRHALYGNQRSH